MLRAYTEDYAGWIEDTARAIEDGRFDHIDHSALADEVRDLGKSERRELRSALSVLLRHLLTMKYQPEKASRSWQATIRVQRNHIEEFLNESPSLRQDCPNCFPAHTTTLASTLPMKRALTSTRSWRRVNGQLPKF